MCKTHAAIRAEESITLVIPSGLVCREESAFSRLCSALLLRYDVMPLAAEV